MGTVRVNGLRYKVFSDDHPPVHAHVDFDRGTVVIAFIEGGAHVLRVDGKVSRSDERRALRTALAAYDAVLLEWERIHR